MVEGARLESVYGFIAHRGFESLPLRQIKTGPSDPLDLPGRLGTETSKPESGHPFGTIWKKLNDGTVISKTMTAHW